VCQKQLPYINAFKRATVTPTRIFFVKDDDYDNDSNAILTKNSEGQEEN